MKAIYVEAEMKPVNYGSLLGNKHMGSSLCLYSFVYTWHFPELKKKSHTGDKYVSKRIEGKTDFVPDTHGTRLLRRGYITH